MEPPPVDEENAGLLSHSNLSFNHPDRTPSQKSRANSYDEDTLHGAPSTLTDGPPDVHTHSDATGQETTFAQPEKHENLESFQNHTRPRRSSGHLSFFRSNDAVSGWWTLELLSYTVSLVSLVAIIVILRHYEGHAQPAWSHNITLNSVLSWFTTLFKANLLVPIVACLSQASWVHFRSGPRPLIDMVVYDSASRGPMGSLRLLFTLRAK